MGYAVECMCACFGVCVCVCTRVELLCVTETCSHELERTDQQQYNIAMNAAVKFSSNL